MQIPQNKTPAQSRSGGPWSSLKPPSKSRIKEITRDYAPLFETWTLNNDKTGFYRTADDIILQQVWFEALRSGDYRPVHNVSMLAKEDSYSLRYEFLDLKHREVSARWHENHIEKTARAMLNQFMPPIAEPLTPQAAWDHIDYEGIGGHIKYHLGVACLAAWLGKTDETVKWISRGLDWLKRIRAEREFESWEAEASADFEDLKTAFNNGTAHAWVEEQAKQYEGRP